MHRLAALCAFALFVGFAGAGAPTLALEPAPALRVVVDPQGVAIGGHDPVAYFSEGRAAPGSEAFEHRWNGAIWRFASAQARDRFAADPEAFAPSYGGWCAWAMSEDRLARGDPLVWRIVGGRLFFNCSAQAQDRWEAELEAAVARGDANWARRIAGSAD